MKLKTWKIISAIAILAISALIHSVYKLIPNNFTALFFSVNESIWEHNKMIFLAFLIWSIIEFIKFKKKNVFFNGFISALICSIFVMLIFTPIYLYILNTKDNIFITIFIYFIAIIISQFVSYKIFNKNEENYKAYLSIFLWLLVFIINAFLTFNPINKPIFYDYNKEVYGIPDNT